VWFITRAVSTESVSPSTGYTEGCMQFYLVIVIVLTYSSKNRMKRNLINKKYHSVLLMTTEKLWLFFYSKCFTNFSQAPVAHACNPSYSGGRHQEDHSLKPAQGNGYTRPYLKKFFTKIGLVEWLKVKALNSSPSTTKKRKKKLYKY
jgi:hypothetical protein